MNEPSALHGQRAVRRVPVGDQVTVVGVAVSGSVSLDHAPAPAAMSTSVSSAVA